MCRRSAGYWGADVLGLIQGGPTNAGVFSSAFESVGGLGKVLGGFIVDWYSPTLILFGMVRGLCQGMPAGIPFEVIGALIGRFYFRKKFGDIWMKYVLVIGAGYACGMGLVAMVGMALAILNKMMAPLLF